MKTREQNRNPILQTKPLRFMASFILITLISLTSCSPQARLQRLIAHHPELTTVDSLHIKDTVIVPGLKLDTAFVFTTKTDSVILHKDKLQVVIKKVHDTLLVEAAIKPDTIYINKEIAVSKIKIIKQSFLTTLKPILPWLVIGLIAVVILILAVSRLKG